jgi:hypothetical protein
MWHSTSVLEYDSCTRTTRTRTRHVELPQRLVEHRKLGRHVLQAVAFDVELAQLRQVACWALRACTMTDNVSK